MEDRMGLGRFEFCSWLFMRVSGLLLATLVTIHVIYLHFVIGVERINFAAVAKRWDNPSWLYFDLALLTLALLHGGNGVRIVLEDHIRRRSTRIASVCVLALLLVLLIVLGARVLFTFDPSVAKEACLVPQV